jgi:probable F420-dependent oxidoreductase
MVAQRGGPRPFRFGVCVHGAPTRAAWAALARKAEALGYATFLVGDHLYWPVAPFAALMAAADATTTLRVGTFVANNDMRHPALLAKEAHTLDLLSDGRFELGLGAGWYAPEYGWIGRSFDPAATRIARLAEAIRIIKGLGAPDPLTVAGAHYAVADLVGRPTPAQRPHPPLLLGGGGRRLLTLAGREADIVHFIPKASESRVNLADSSPAAMAARVGWVRAAAGERFGAIELGTLLFDLAVTADERSGAEALAARWTGHPQGAPVTGAQLLDSVSVLVGNVEQIVARLRRWREELGISYIVVFTEPQMEAFAPVVARLAGT